MQKKLHLSGFQVVLPHSLYSTEWLALQKSFVVFIFLVILHGYNQKLYGQSAIQVNYNCLSDGNLIALQTDPNTWSGTDEGTGYIATITRLATSYDLNLNLGGGFGVLFESSDFPASPADVTSWNLQLSGGTPIGCDPNVVSVQAGPPVVNLSVSNNAGTEAGTSTITVTATADMAVMGDQTVDLSVSGTNITVGDYTLSGTTITILNGLTMGSVSFTVQDDNILEGDETATLTISNPSAGITLGTPTMQEITITDNDNVCPSSGSDLVIYVNVANATPSNGLTWGSAYDNLQDALEIACNCPEVTEIWVAAGTYYPDEGFGQTDNDRNSTFQLCNNVALYGGFAGTEDPNTFSIADRDLVTNETILSGDIDQNNSLDDGNAYNVVNGSQTDNTAVINGFTVTAGNANGDTAINSLSSGGGFYIEYGSLVISQMTISGNSAIYGGGIYIGRDSSDPFLTSEPLLTNVIISGNIANLSGGGIFNDIGSIPILVNVIISGNRAVNGGGIYILIAVPILTNVTITGNIATRFGGGIYNSNNSVPVLTNVIVWNNSQNGSTDVSGASIYNERNSPTINSSIIANIGSNSDLNPEFILPVDPATAPTTTGDFRLQPTSPAINIGDNAADIDGVGSGTQTIADIPTDLAGENRIQESIVDLGAYEQLSCAGLISATASNQDVSTNTITLDGNNPGSGTGQWSIISGDGNGYFGDTPGTLTSSDPTSSFTGTLGQTYTLEWEISLEDCESSVEVSITFNCDAVVATASDQAVSTNMVSLDGNDPGNGTGQWSIISGDGNGYFGNTPGTLTASDPTSSFTGTLGQTYTLEWGVTLGDCESSIQVMITFNCSAVVATATSQAFEANTISLNGSDPAMGTGQWRIISGDGNGYFGDTPGTLTTNNPISTFTGTPRQEYTLEWKIIEGNCESSVQIMLTIPEVEEIPLFASPWAKLGFSMLLLGLMSLLMLRRRF